MWAQGSGIHLSSNSINQTVGEDENNAAFDVRTYYFRVRMPTTSICGVVGGGTNIPRF